MTHQSMVLVETLRLAVPLHIQELRDSDLTPGQLAAIAHAAAGPVGSQGDALQFGGKGCAEAFNALARGLAAAALTAWGGVDFAGLHWCARTGCDDRDAPHDAPTWPDTARLALPDSRPVEEVPTSGRT
jgi:hypothetical protein